MEGGLVSDFRKIVLDADQLSMMQRMVSQVDLSDNGQAMDAIRETGPGQHFLGSSHTQANFEDAFWRSEMADNTTFEQWSTEGAIESAKRAENKARQLLAEYEAPSIDAGIDEALQAFKAKRMEELPDSEY